MNLVRYDPWSILRGFHNELNRIGWPESTGVEDADDASRVVGSRWYPAVDIREEEDRYEIEADVPGINPKDIKVTMENNVLTLKGERKQEKETTGEGYKRLERAQGVFYRRFGLPDGTDASKISARTNNGVLHIVLPKQEKVQPRRIEVRG